MNRRKRVTTVVAAAVLGATVVNIRPAAGTVALPTAKTIKTAAITTAAITTAAIQPLFAPLPRSSKPFVGRTFTESSPGHFRITQAEAIPTFDYMGQDGGPYRLIDLPLALAEPHLDPRRRALYEASWRRTAAEVDRMGGATAGLIVVAPGAAR